MITIPVQVAERVAPDNPRGSRLAAAAFVALLRGVSALMQRVPAQARTRAQEARAVRAMATEWQHSDPRFAADLFAAADRHESQHGVV